MTRELKLSDMKSFGITAEMIENYASECRDWLHRQVMVEQTKNEEDETKRWANHPAPMAVPLIVSCVNAEGNSDYVVIDDTIEVLAKEFPLKQDALFRQIADIEQVEKYKLIPKGKERLIDLHEKRIRDADNAIALKTLGTPEEIMKAVVSARDPTDQQFLDELASIRNQLTAIDWWAAEQHSAIGDLTIDTIDTWKITPYKA